MSTWKEEQKIGIFEDYMSDFNIDGNETMPSCLIRSTPTAIDMYKSSDKQYVNTQRSFPSKCKIYCLCRDSQVSSCMLLYSTVEELLVTLNHSMCNYLTPFGDKGTEILSLDKQQAGCDADNHYFYSPGSSKMRYSTWHEFSSGNSSALTSSFNNREPCSEALSVSPPLCRLLRDVRIDSSEHQRALRRNKSLPNHLECMNKENIPNIVEESTENKVYQDGDLHNFPERNLNSDSLSSGFEEFNQNTVEERQSSFAKPNILPHSMLYFIDFSTGMRSSLASTSSSELDQSIIRVSSSNTWCLPNFSTFKEKHCDDGLCDVFDSTENNENSLPDGMLELLTAPLIQTHKPESQQKGKKLTTRARIRRCLSMKMEENESRNEASKKMNTNCISPPIHPHFLSSSSHILPSCVSLPGLKMDSKSNNDKREKELVITSDTPLALIQEEMDFYKDLKSTFKRPEPPKGLGSPIQSKRRKSIPLCEPFIRKPVQRSCSETEATIIKALMKSDMNPNLIGDFSKPYALPLIEGKQRELKNISPDTLVKLLTGCYSDLISGYTIVDCRYPYEYEGGHVIGAKNIYTKPGIVQEFFSNVKKPSQKNCRHIIVFHCEFSSERGPALYKFLREMDRQANKECYPQLYHPEMYILDGGYKAFYEKHWEFCEPQQYKPMKHKDHKHDLYHFRAKSKSLNEDSKTKVFVSSSLIF